MTEKRFQLVLYDNSMRVKEVRDNGKVIYPNEIVDLLNGFDEHIKELKQEVELLKEGLKAYDENLPLYLTPMEIRDFNSDLFEFKIKRQKFYNEHPRLCKIIVDGKELEK